MCPHLTRREWTLVAGLGAYVVLYVSWLVFHWIPGDRDVVGGVLQQPTNVVAIATVWWASRRARNAPRVALSWRLIMWGLIGQLAGGIASDVYTLAGSKPYPSVADALFLSFYPCVLAGLLVMPAARRARSQWVGWGSILS
jgi:hypothetical protein